MKVVGLQGSPRKGNTHFLLSEFKRSAENQGAEVVIIETAERNIIPCKECGVCVAKGYCSIDDNISTEIFTLLREADVVVMAAPVFFYSVPAQLKALIDRCQVLWARRYRLGLVDSGRRWRKGFLLSLGATKGKRLFDGIRLTAKYFFDAIGARFEGELVYRGIEHAGDIQKYVGITEDVEKSVKMLLDPLRLRKKILFACTENACRSQIAAAFAQRLFGDKLECISAGSHPAFQINPMMIEAMAEKGIDMAFRKPRSMDAALRAGLPEIIISMGCGEACPAVSKAEHEKWDIPDPSGKSLDFMRCVRDDIETRVVERFAGIYQKL